MKRPLIYDLATQWHSNRFPLMACYYHLPYRANNNSWEKPAPEPREGAGCRECGTPAPSRSGRAAPSPAPAGASRGEAGCWWESSSQPLLWGLGTHGVSGGKDISATDADAVPPPWDF